MSSTELVTIDFNHDIENQYCDEKSNEILGDTNCIYNINDRLSILDIYTTRTGTRKKKWRIGKVIDVARYSITIKFEGWGDKYNIHLDLTDDIDKKRIAPLNSINENTNLNETKMEDISLDENTHDNNDNTNVSNTRVSNTNKCDYYKKLLDDFCFIFGDCFVCIFILASIIGLIILFIYTFTWDGSFIQELLKDTHDVILGDDCSDDECTDDT